MFRKILDGIVILSFLLLLVLVLKDGTGGVFGAGNGSISHTNSQFDALGGFSVNGAIAIDSSGNVSSTSGNTNSLTIGGGTAMTKYNCATTSWNPPTLTVASGTTPASSTFFTVTGAAVGDLCKASFSQATSTDDVVISCNIGSASTSTFTIFNASRNNAVDFATGTAKVCYTH